MATYSIGAESCLKPRVPVGPSGGWSGPVPVWPEERAAAKRGNSSCLTAIGYRGPDRSMWHMTKQVRWWITHASEAQALCDGAGVTVESALCSGCARMYRRLVRAGQWP